MFNLLLDYYFHYMYCVVVCLFTGIINSVDQWTFLGMLRSVRSKLFEDFKILKVHQHLCNGIFYAFLKKMESKKFFVNKFEFFKK